jgi:hypothetical protein
MLWALGREGSACAIHSQFIHLCGAGWRCEGDFAEGAPRPCGEWDLGEMWECPFFIAPPDLDAAPSTAALHGPS